MFPVEDAGLKEEICHILQVQLDDNVKAHILQPDGSYEKIDKRGKILLNSQEFFSLEAIRRVEVPEEELRDRVFIPAEPVREEE